jgi:hypothetical protein
VPSTPGTAKTQTSVAGTLIDTYTLRGVKYLFYRFPLSIKTTTKAQTITYSFQNVKLIHFQTSW